MDLVRIMTVGFKSDKDMFECSYPEYQEKRESTTFWGDFTIADAYGVPAIKDTYRRAFEEWKDNYKYLTELVCVLNHKIWEHYHKGDAEKQELYNSLWEQADAYGTSNLKGDELRFFLCVLD